MTIEDIRRELELMREKYNDSELQHSIKDALYVAVLTYISKGEYDDVGDPRHPPFYECAREALKAEKIPEKWSSCE